MLKAFFKYWQRISRSSRRLSAEGISMSSRGASPREVERFVGWRLGLNHREKHVQNSGVRLRGRACTRQLHRCQGELSSSFRENTIAKQEATGLAC